MSITLEMPKLTDLRPRITVIGVGGAGGNAVNNMIASGLSGVEFIVANTDAQALTGSNAGHKIQLGIHLTEGLGAGSKPEIGEAAAEEVLDDIRAQITGSHMVFIAAGMGGGTGTGAAGVIARCAKDLGILAVGVVTKPFHFEGARRMRIAEAGIAELEKYVDTLIVIPNQNLFRIANEKTTFGEAFVLADQVLYSGIACIVDLIVKEGLINLDFADVRTVMSGMGTAMMGTGEATGERRAIIAAEEAITNPLLDDVQLRGARGLLLSILGGRDLTLYEVDEAASRVREEVDPEANIIVGATFDESLGDRIRVSIVASGMIRSALPDMQSPRRPESARSTIPTQNTGTDERDAFAAPPSPVRPTSLRQSADHGVRDPAPSDRHRPSPASPEPKNAFNAPSQGLERGPVRGSHPLDPAELRRTPATSWMGPSGVVVEEGLPHLGIHGSPPPLPGENRNTAAPNHEFFAPAPPAEIRRGSLRVPDIDDFPPLAQREYRARHNPVSPPQPRANPPATDPGPERRGLLGRLTGRNWRRSESQETPAGGTEPRYDHPRDIYPGDHMPEDITEPPLYRDRERK